MTDASPCVKRSKMNGSSSGAMPSPVSVTVTTALGPIRDQRQRDVPAGRRELDRVDDQVPDHLLQPIRIAEHRALEVGVAPRA